MPTAGTATVNLHLAEIVLQSDIGVDADRARRPKILVMPGEEDLNPMRIAVAYKASLLRRRQLHNRQKCTDDGYQYRCPTARAIVLLHRLKHCVQSQLERVGT